MNLVIKNYTELSETALIKSGKTLLKNEGLPAVKYFKNIYNSQNVSYPKFHKMDRLCKLGFLATEVLLMDDDNFNDIPDHKKAIIVQNYSSSIDTDIKHQESINDRENYYPSPAVFVYTLPNIMLGEICIRHNIKGENSCFLSPSFDALFIDNYVRALFEYEDYESCITGWVDYNEDNYSAYLFLIERESTGEAFISKFDKHILELMIKNHGELD